jgi:dihydroxyacetone kinase phosphoprotein-dependent L subunit
MEELGAKETKELLLLVCEFLMAAEKDLCELDSHVGDGDHGITVSRGFKAVKEKLKNTGLSSPGELFILSGGILAETMGGAAGPVFGSIFLAMGEALKGAASWGAGNFASMLEAALEDAMKTGDVKKGERTLIDALAPAAEVAKEASAGGDSLRQTLEKTVSAAEAGAESTKEMVAKKGRAKFLQEKSRGFKDAGAVSVCLILKTIYGFVSCR